MSYDQEKDKDCHSNLIQPQQLVQSGKKRVSIFGVASRCITSDMLQTFKRQIISPMTCMTFSQFLFIFYEC